MKPCSRPVQRVEVRISMLFRNEDVDMTSSMNASTNESDPGQLWRRLASDLSFSTEKDSAAALSALLDHYRRKESKSSEGSISVLVDENVSSSDVVCVVALNTATEWLSQSEERADALFQYDSFMNQVNEWTGEYKGEKQLSPYVSGLQVLLRMCMNSERPAKVSYQLIHVCILWERPVQCRRAVPLATCPCSWRALGCSPVS